MLRAEYVPPVQTFLEGTKPIPASTHTAHDVKPYTNSSGKYVIVLQHRRSTLRAQLRRRIAREGDDGGDGEPNVAMLAKRQDCRASAKVYGRLDAAE